MQKTIYTMRLRTNTQRGSGIDTQSAGVQLGLINKDGDCFLHWVSPVNDPECNLAELQKVCEVRKEKPLAVPGASPGHKSGWVGSETTTCDLMQLTTSHQRRGG